jgi:FKBP-type peptidyl-prolyl cis-trans isomerase
MLRKFFECCLLVSVLTLLACKEKTAREARIINISDTLKKANQSIVAEQKMVIEAFLSRKGWPYKTTGTGLYYHVYYSPSEQKKIADGDFVSIAFSLEDLKGNVFYDVFHKQKVTFRVGHDRMEAGIHEVMLNLKKGDKCYVLLPPHLAFGLTGNEHIPPYTILLYNLEVQRVEPSSQTNNK